MKLPISTSIAKRAARAALVVGLLSAAAVVANPAGASQTATCGGRAVTIHGTSGNDTIFGTEGDDVIYSGSGDDNVYGLGGRDRICSGGGKDFVDGGAGNDWIWLGERNDKSKGGSGRDVIYGGAGNDIIVGGYGGDRLYGNNGNDRIVGGAGNDDLYGFGGNDRIEGGTGTDRINGGNDTDTCVSPGDTITGCELPVIAGPTAAGAYEAEMLSIINSERAKRGLSAVTRQANFDSYAQAWAAEMSTIPLPLNASKHHSPAFTGSGYPFQGLPSSVAWTAAFENVGFSTIGSSESPSSVMNRLFYSPGGSGFMTSAGHKCNILETAADGVGLGAYVDPQGNLWVAHLFFGNDWPLPAPIGECASTVSR